LVRARDDIGRQPLVTRRVFSDDNHSLMHLGVLTQNRLDLRQLHPEPAQLHLVVDPADELDVAVGTITREGAGPVEPRRGLSAAWVRDKSFRGQVGAVRVAARQAVAADVQLTRDPNWYRLELRVQNVGLRVRKRAADEDGVLPAIATPARRIDTRFG